jgi:hypothetical protein
MSKSNIGELQHGYHEMNNRYLATKKEKTELWLENEQLKLTLAHNKELITALLYDEKLWSDHAHSSGLLEKAKGLLK